MSTNLQELVWTPSAEEILAEREWILSKINGIGLPVLQQLAKQAAEKRIFAYAPYSNYTVGVALLSVSGRVYPGVNVERVSFSETDHAEEAAITGATVDGEILRSGRKFIKALAVSHQGDSAPCGRCRQIIAENCDNTLIITADPNGDIRKITSLKTLFPFAFTPSHLRQD